MMTKDRYVELRNLKNQNSIANIFWEYYVYKQGNINNKIQFFNYFNQWITFFNIDIDYILDYLDNQYKVTIVYKNNKFIKVI